MAFSLNGLIDAASFNNLATNPAAGSSVNSLYGTGVGVYGYGQPSPIANVAVNDTITSSQWSSLNTRITAMGNHQNTALGGMPNTGVNQPITYDADYPNNILALKGRSLYAAAQGTTQSLTTQSTSQWSNSCTFTHTITFASGDAARYFFNAGGQLKFTFYSPIGTSNTINYVMHYLGEEVGTVVLSAPASGKTTIAGVDYNGISQKGAQSLPVILDANKGYYGLSTSYSTVFKQLAKLGITTYFDSFIKIDMKTNGPVGANQDNGNIITVVSTWDEVPNGLAVSVYTAVTCTVVPPSTTYLNNSWGTPTVTGSFVAV
jgi:hypothetical protein